MTGSTNYKNPAQKALDFIAVARNPYFAWRYGVKPGDNDTSVTGWMTTALRSARLVNHADNRHGRQSSLQIDEEAFDGIKAWVDKMTTSSTFSPPLTIPYGLMAVGMTLLVVQLVLQTLAGVASLRRSR